MLGYLNNRFSAEFVVLEKNKITRDEMQYTVALKDDESVTFTITNELIVTGRISAPKEIILIVNRSPITLKPIIHEGSKVLRHSERLR